MCQCMRVQAIVALLVVQWTSASPLSADSLVRAASRTAAAVVVAAAAVGAAADRDNSKLPYWLEIRPPARAHAASDEEREQIGESLTYGELTNEGAQMLAKILSIQAKMKADEFLDLGSGRGQLCVWIAEHTPVAASSCVEYAKARHDLGVEELNTFSDTSPERASKVHLVHGDLFEWLPAYDSATVAFVNSLAMSADFKARLPPLYARMEKMRHIVSGIKLHSECKPVVLPMSWGTATYSMYSCYIGSAWKANTILQHRQRQQPRGHDDDDEVTQLQPGKGRSEL